MLNKLCEENVQSVKDGLLECGGDYSCYSQKGQWMAVAKKDETICNNIGDVFTRADCYTKVAGVKQDTSICENIKSIKSDLIPSVLTDDCYRFVEFLTD